MTTTKDEEERGFKEERDTSGYINSDIARASWGQSVKMKSPFLAAAPLGPETR